MRNYQHKAIEELAAELSSGLLRLRRGYLDAAEELVRLIDPGQTYPYEFIVYRLTGYRPGESNSSSLLEGKSLREDLLQLLLDVSESFDFRTSDTEENVYDTDALARQFKVSTKTVQRWRKRGLPARRMIFPDGRRRIGFLEGSVDWFTQNHAGDIQRSSRFSQMTDKEREDILHRARRMALFTDCSLSEVVQRLSKRSGRAAETIRYTIRNHDKEHPEEAIFPRLLAQLGEKEKQHIYRSFLRGRSVAAIAKRYHRTRSSMYRIINEMRARQLLERTIDYVPNPEFEEPDAEERILRDAPSEAETFSKKPRNIPEDLPPYLRSLYEVPLLTQEGERDLFRRYNYLKYRANLLRESLDVNQVTSGQVKKVESLLLQANVVKNRIIRSNLRLVVSIAKKHIAGPMRLFELISDGNVSLMRAVEKFDYSRGFRFSTYASWAIMRNFARSVPKERYHLDRFATGQEEILDIAAGLNQYDPQETNLTELRESIEVMLSHLSPRERTVLIDHYGLDDTSRAKTFQELGQQLGISKERVRQIEMQALEKLREFTSAPQGQSL